MHRISIHRAGHYDQLRWEPAAEPTPGPGEVAIEVHAAGVNYADCIVRMGLYSSAREYVGWPITPGFEVAGVVRAVGEGTDGLRPGDEVVAVTRFGGYAETIVVPRHQVFARPAGLDAVQAAALPTVFLTAWYALDLARPTAGDAVLVHSASGGVGQALVQLARLRGCRVVGTVGAPHKVDLAMELGADAAVDRSRRDAWSVIRGHAPSGYAAVFDATGVSTLRRGYRSLAPRGTLVIYGFSTMLPRAGRRVSWLRLAWSWLRTPRFDPLHLTQHNHGVVGFNLSYLFAERTLLEAGMAELLRWLEDGTLRVPPIETIPMRDAAQAHRRLEGAQTVGKLVLTTDACPRREDAGR